jgi:hypothetical protein
MNTELATTAELEAAYQRLVQRYPCLTTAEGAKDICILACAAVVVEMGQPAILVDLEDTRDRNERGRFSGHAILRGSDRDFVLFDPTYAQMGGLASPVSGYAEYSEHLRWAGESIISPQSADRAAKAARRILKARQRTADGNRWPAIAYASIFGCIAAIAVFRAFDVAIPGAIAGAAGAWLLIEMRGWYRCR